MEHSSDTLWELQDGSNELCQGVCSLNDYYLIYLNHAMICVNKISDVLSSTIGMLYFFFLGKIYHLQQTKFANDYDV